MVTALITKRKTFNCCALIVIRLPILLVILIRRALESIANKKKIHTIKINLGIVLELVDISVLETEAK